MIPMPHPVIADLLARDERLLALVNDARSSEERGRELFPAVASAIRRDVREKERDLYPAVRDADPHGADLVRDAVQRHRGLEWMIAEAGRIGPGHDGFLDAAQAVYAAAISLILAERRDMIPVLERNLTVRELNRLRK